MKITFLIPFLAASLVLAAPNPSLETRDVAAAAKDNCFHKSSCSTFWFGKGNEYCDGRGFSHMTRDGCSKIRLQQAICCIRP